MSLGLWICFFASLMSVSCERPVGREWLAPVDTEYDEDSNQPVSADSVQPSPCVDSSSSAVVDSDVCITEEGNTAQAGVLFVNQDVEESGDGRCWRTAFKMVQEAVDFGRQAGQPYEIWVAEGTYYVHQERRADTIALYFGVSLYGGFAGSEMKRWEREPTQNVTILDGENAEFDESVYSVITGADGAVVDGFLIRNGNSRSDRYGGGMYNVQVTMHINNCRFENNYAGQAGGAIFNSHSTLSITNCTFLDNEAGREGGAIYSQNSFVEVKNSVFAFNSALKYGGAVVNHSHAEAAFINCTFFGNRVDSCGGAIADRYRSSSTIISSILWHNEALENKEICLLEKADESIISHSDVEGYTGAISNFDVDPQFVDSENDNFRLHPNSPCIDGGIDAHAMPKDREGKSRDGRVDIGAYEYQGDSR